MDFNWTSWPPQNRVDDFASDANFSAQRRMGLATLDVDRITALEVIDKTSHGSITTEVVDVDSEIHVNVSNVFDQRAWLCAELLDDSGSPISGFSKADSIPVTREGSHVPLKWRTDTIPADSYRLRIHLNGPARLHAIEIS